MTIEEAIRHFEAVSKCSYKPTREAAQMALSALRAQQEAEKNEPLTLEELQEMDGQPVWLDDAPNGWKCFIINLEFPVKDGRIWSAPCGVDAWGRATSLPLLAECGLYRHPPKEAPYV